MTVMSLHLLPLVLALLVQDPLPSNGKGGSTGTRENESIKVGDQARTFHLVVPEKLDPAKPAPLVFVFHGRGDSKDWIRRYSGLEELAPKQGFIAVFPAGLEKQWDLRTVDDNPDLKFFDALFEHLTTKYNVDLRRVYLTGMSMGGYFSNLVASKRSEKIAAIAPHSGGLGVLAVRGVKAAKKYAVMVIHGDADRIVKVDEGRTSRDAYAKEGHAVEYVEVKGMGHVWARREGITDRIWKFFIDHPMK